MASRSFPNASESGFRGHKTGFIGYQSAADRSACEQSLEESDNLPDPEVLAQEVVEDREAAREQVRFNIHAPSL